MSDKLNIAVVGTGAVAQVVHIPQWKKIGDVQLLAVCDRNKNKAQWIADRYRIPRVFDDIEELLKLEEVQAVDICTPTQSHLYIAEAALSSGKHVLVEKPMARNYEESKNMVDAAQRYRRKLMVAMNVRFRQDAIILKSFLNGGDLGEIFYSKTGWLRKKEKMLDRSWLYEKEISGGGVFMDLGIQMLDVGLWLMGDVPVESVKAATYNKINKLEVEDSAAAFLRLNNGATLTVEVSWTLLSEKDFFYTNLFGTHGGALLNPLRIHKELHGNLVNVTPNKVETQMNLYKKSYQNELLHFVDSLKNSTPLVSSGAEMLERMRVVEAVYESAKSGREIELRCD
ncbi:MAG: Gfo/Idh/MocA family protein [bacterium]